MVQLPGSVQGAVVHFHESLPWDELLSIAAACVNHVPVGDTPPPPPRSGFITQTHCFSKLDLDSDIPLSGVNRKCLHRKVSQGAIHTTANIYNHDVKAERNPGPAKPSDEYRAAAVWSAVC